MEKKIKFMIDKLSREILPEKEEQEG